MQQPSVGSVPTNTRHPSESSQAEAPGNRILSQCAPYLYLTGAFAAFFATLYVTDWFWILPHSVLLSAALLHLVLAFKRR